MKIRIVLGLLLILAQAGSVFALGKDQTTPNASPLGASRLERATFAGGCFWCMEEALDGLDGVISTTSGYTGGQKGNPTYEEVSAGGTGHTEAVQITYDAAKVDYAKILELFWRNIDPSTPNKQFCDVGSQYRSAIFYHNETQKRLAEDSKKMVERTKKFSGPVVTEIVSASEFYPAEEYHQNFYLKNPIRYKFYKYSCGRAQRLEQLWGKATPAP
jgi:peptide-methionine (S)-S-oxide reductase